MIFIKCCQRGLTRADAQCIIQACQMKTGRSMMDVMFDAGRTGSCSFFTNDATKREQNADEMGKTGNKSGPASEGSVKGMIPYPCCPKERVMVFRGAHGRVSNKCPRCGRFARFDYDLMTASEVRAVRGATRMYKQQD